MDLKNITAILENRKQFISSKCDFKEQLKEGTKLHNKIRHIEMLKNPSDINHNIKA